MILKYIYNSVKNNNYNKIKLKYLNNINLTTRERIKRILLYNETYPIV